MPLNIDDLRSFILVTNERSVTGAAGKLKVTQQSVSERIRRLEARLGTQLFERRPHGMQPSPAGFRFLPYATQAVALLDQAAAVIGDDDLIRAAVQRDVSSAVLPLLAPLAGAHHVEIAVTDSGEEGIVASLKAGDIDMGIGVFNNLPAPTQPGKVAARRGRDAGDVEALVGEEIPEGGPDVPIAEMDVVAESVFSDPLIWVVPPGHPLTHRSRALSVTELIPAPGNGSGPSSEGSATSSELQGLRVGTRSALEHELTSGELVELAVDQPGWVVPVSIAYRSTEVDRPALDTVRSALRDHDLVATNGKARHADPGAST